MNGSANQTINSSGQYTAKLNNIKFGAMTLQLNPITQALEISTVGQTPYFINSETGHSNIQVDLENRTINHLTINNLSTTNLTAATIINPELADHETRIETLEDGKANNNYFLQIVD